MRRSHRQPGRHSGTPAAREEEIRAAEERKDAGGEERMEERMEEDFEQDEERMEEETAGHQH